MTTTTSDWSPFLRAGFSVTHDGKERLYYDLACTCRAERGRGRDNVWRVARICDGHAKLLAFEQGEKGRVTL